MTPTERQAWDAKISALKHAGVPMPERVERATRELAREAAARAEPEPPDPAPPAVCDDNSTAGPAAESDACNATAGNVGPFSGPLVQQPTRPTDPVAGEVAGAPAGAVQRDAGQSEAEVPGEVHGAEQGGPGHDNAEALAGAVGSSEVGGAGADSAAPGKAKGATPATSSSMRQAGTRRRRTQSRTVRKDSKTMAAVHAKRASGSEPHSGSGLKIVREEAAPSRKLNGQDRDRPARDGDQKADNVHARLIDAAAAARLCGVSKSGWWAFHAAGRCPLPVRLGRATRWRRDELSDWIDAGCPSRSKWTWKPGRRR